MRDIRTDLTDRIKAIKQERDTISIRLKELDDLEKTVGEMLRLEEKIHTKGQTNLFGQNGEGPNVTAFVRTALSENPVITVHKVLKIAQESGFTISGARPGQSIQGALLALKKQGIAESLGDGRWSIAEPNNH